MKTQTKALLLVAGLLAAGTLFAQGPGFGNGYGPGYSYYGNDFGPGMMGRHMMGHGPMMGFGGWGEEDTASRLQQTHDALGITPAQQAAWNDYVNAVKEQQTAFSKLHSGASAAFTTGPDGRTITPHDVMWQSRNEVLKATDALYQQLTPAQRQSADRALGFGPHM